MVIGRLLVFQPTDLFWHEHVEYGASLYDLHSDGSGVCYSSRLRPILNMRPKYSSWVGGAGSGLWQFNADTHLTDWLEREGLPSMWSRMRTCTRKGSTRWPPTRSS
jgi:N,N-dimethylformamidase